MIDVKFSHAQPVPAETLEEQKGGPQVQMSGKVGSIRGFCILAAILSLTIFVGLVFLAVMNDINDQKQQNGYYGHSSEAVDHEDCRFHLLSLDWLKPGFQDKEPMEKFRDVGPGDWFTDADLNEASDEPCHVKDMPARVDGKP